MTGTLARVRNKLRATLWPLPTLGLVAAIALGVAVPELDRRLDGSMPGWLSSAIFNGDAAAARTVLDAVSSSLITVTSLTFSLTVVTLQLASSQFSPRLLRTFSSDLFVQVTLAIFLSTFVYSLTVLRLIRSADGSASPFVPRVAVTLAFLLAVTSVFALVLFLAHLARMIRVESMLRNVHREASATMRSALPGRTRTDDPDETVPSVPSTAETVLAVESGFLTGTNEAELLHAATRAGAVVLLDAQPGDFVVEGVPVARVWSDQRGRLSTDQRDVLARKVTDSMSVGFERTSGRDIGFGLRQLTDVANKALSPGINDPTTAVHAIGHLAVLLCEAADRQLGPRLLRDDDDRLRVVASGPSFADLVEVAITQPRRYGASDPQVAGQLFRLLAQLAWRVPAELHPVVVEHLGRLESSVAAQDYDPAEVELLARHGAQVRSTLHDRHRHPHLNSDPDPDRSV